MNKIALIYIGRGAFTPPYPARDLTEDEVAGYGKEALLKTGLYKEPATEKKSEPNKKEKEK